MMNKIVTVNNQNYNALFDTSSKYYETQEERVELLSNDASHWQTLQENSEREIHILKEENARILSDLFHSKEEIVRQGNSAQDGIAQREEPHQRAERGSGR